MSSLLIFQEIIILATDKHGKTRINTEEFNETEDKAKK